MSLSISDQSALLVALVSVGGSISSSLASTKWQSQLLMIVLQSISSKKHLSRSIRSLRPMLITSMKHSISPSISSSQQSLQATMVAMVSTQEHLSKETGCLVARQYRTNRHSDRFIRNGWGLSQMSAIVQTFISICGISIDRMVLTEFSEKSSSLLISSLLSELPSSMMKIDIFLLAPRATLSCSFWLSASSFLVTSPSKHTREPMFIFLKERIRSFWRQLPMNFSERCLLSLSASSWWNWELRKKCWRKRSSLWKSSCSSYLSRVIFWLCRAGRMETSSV